MEVVGQEGTLGMVVTLGNQVAGRDSRDDGHIREPGVGLLLWSHVSDSDGQEDLEERGPPRL